MSAKSAADHLSAEASIVLPDRDITVSDPRTGKPMDVTVREYRFREGLRAQALAGELIADIAALSADPDTFSPSALNAVLGGHAEAWIELCALATGLGRDVIEALREPDTMTLSVAVWEVNAVFFTSRILGETLGRDALKTMWASLTSSTASPPPDMETPRTS